MIVVLFCPQVNRFSNFFKGSGLCAQEFTNNDVQDRKISIGHDAMGNKVKGDSFDIRKSGDHPPIV